jgi:hypothetical protein
MEIYPENTKTGSLDTLLALLIGIWKGFWAELKIESSWNGDPP